MCSEEAPNSSAQNKHKEKGEKRRQLDSDDRQRIGAELEKHSYPLSINTDVLYNIENVQEPLNEVSVIDAVFIGEKMANSSRNCLPSGVYAKISSQVKTVEQLKRGMKVGYKTVFDLETIFIRLHMVRQNRQLQLAHIFQHELCTISPSLIDENGCDEADVIMTAYTLKLQNLVMI